MTPPPTSIDGTDITGATIDGQDVQEITVDGQTVFIASRDISMFSSPIIRFDAEAVTAPNNTSPVDFPETLGGTSDATPVDNPIFRANQSGKPAIEYDGSDDGHNWTASGNVPTANDSFSWAVLIYLNGPESQIVSFGNNSNNEKNAFVTVSGGNEFRHFFFNNDLDSGSNIPLSQWITLGISYDGTTREMFVNGSLVNSDTPSTPNVQDTNGAIGYLPGIGQTLDGYISEIILSDVAESASSFSSYDNDRI